MNSAKRQAIPTLRMGEDVDPISDRDLDKLFTTPQIATDEHGVQSVLPSQALAAASSHVDAIEYEVKPRTDGANWHRFTCRACGRVGTWLSEPEKVRANGMAHAAWHGEGEP